MFKPNTTKQLKNAIILYCSNERKCIKKYGNPDQWNVSNITDMSNMFEDSQFNADISNWDVSNVVNMSKMFYRSKFNSDIS